MPAWLKEFFGDRIQLNSLLIVMCFASVLALDSQSAASYPSYFLALSMLFSIRHWNDVTQVPFFWCLAGLVGYLFLTSFWSDPVDGRRLSGMFFRCLLVIGFVIAMAECQARGLAQRWLGRALAVVGALSAIAAIAAYIVTEPPGGRLSGLGQLDNPVVVGLVFGAVFILLLDIIFSDSSNSWKLTALVGAAAVCVAIYLSGSRNAWLSTIIGSLVFGIAWRVSDRQRFVATLMALAVILIALIGGILASEWGREVLLPRGDSFRLDIWSVVLRDLINGSWIFGNGILTPDGVNVGEEVFNHPHNMYLTVLFQGGLVALLLFSATIGWALSRLMADYDQKGAKLALGLLAMALTSYVLDGHELIDKVGETWFLFWLPISIALGLSWSRTLRGD